ncbi:MAG: sporulation integral membrane protein YtvI [Oscillospiraceae bacterium]|nr:sporulation integral membrane protein YtvI [Oscillospiraceae bacterium]MDD7293202.1 sporulation integral membrane protein YtvI [Clostridiaceae bacterium]MDY5992323.1 sporulation integral membrane protein YtvI [Oscillospiraceae bacterium]
MQEVEKRKRTIINVIYFAIIVVIGFLAVRYALSVCLPFAIAFVFAAILQKPKKFLVKKAHFKNGAAAGLCVFLALLIVAALISLVGVRIFDEIKGFISYIGAQLKNLDEVVNNIETWLMNLISSLPEFLSKTLKESASDLFSSIREYLAGESNNLSSSITSSIGEKFEFSWITGPLSGVISTAKQLPTVFLSVLISIIACCFMTSEFDEIKAFIVCQFPEHRRKDLSRAKHILRSSLGKMGKAYLLIMLVTFIEVSIGLTVLKLLNVFNSSYIMLIAAGTAVVDILPVLGTGTVLIPWAAYSLITGNLGMGIGLLVLYAVITVVRQIVEPKLVAGQLGLSPIVTIAALYFGLKVFGVLGMFVTPILVIMLKLLNDEGIIKLWKSPVKLKAEDDTAEKTDEPDGKEEKASKKKAKIFGKKK